jgi:gliding motility-associated-like protein
VYNPLTCAVYDTFVKPFISYPSSDARFSAKKDSCSDLVIFTNQSVNNSQSPIAYLWNFGDGQTSTQKNPTHIYIKDTSYIITLITNPNTPCADTADTTIDYRVNSYLLTADFLLTDSTLCAPAYFSATNTGTNGKYFYWYLNTVLVNNTNAGFGDTLKQAGKFTIRLVVLDSNTCKVRDTLEKNIVVNLQAYADFIMQRDSCSLDVVFRNLSNTNNVPLIWRFGDGDSSKEFSPSHQYAVTGTYKVNLIFNQGNFCADTAENVYFIDGDSGQQVVIPNVFTPNGDGINDCYQVTGVSQKCDEYHILIFNRWGIPVYENTNGNWCWDGKNQGGEDIPQGVYYYIITIKKKNGYQRKDHGTITLIRDH